MDNLLEWRQLGESPETSPENGPALAEYRTPATLSWPVSASALSGKLSSLDSLAFDPISFNHLFAPQPQPDLNFDALTPFTTLDQDGAPESVSTEQNEVPPKRGRASQTVSRSAPAQDKRARNTEASARFRRNKKLRDSERQQALEELERVNGELHERINVLERENTLLRSLIVDRESSSPVI